MLRASEQLVAEYQRLLTGIESLPSLRRAIRLAWEILGVRAKLRGDAVVFEPLNGNGTALAEQLRQTFGSGELPESFYRGELPPSQHAGSAEQRRLRGIAVETTAALAVAPAIGAIPAKLLDDAKYSLFTDTCLLLAHQVYFALLPKLDEAALSPERKLLLSAFHQFADSLIDTSDRFALLALYFDALGEPRKASEHHRAALVATPADAHEFMTMLQTSWTSLIERGSPSEALELLLDNYPRVPRRDLEEVSELIRQTFRLGSTSANGHSARSGGQAAKRRKN